MMATDPPDARPAQELKQIDYATPKRLPGVEQMSRRDFALIAFRIIAMLTAYNALMSLVPLGINVVDRGLYPLKESLPMLIMAAFYCGITLFLWLGAARLTTLILWKAQPLSVPPDNLQPVSSLVPELLGAAIAMMGIWMLAFEAIPLLIWDAVAIVFHMHDGGVDAVSRTNGLQLLDAVVKTCVGLYLFVRARKLAFRWSRFKNADLGSHESASAG
jgi:hypothetical protein